MRRLKKYQEWVQIGVQNAVPKTINWSKLYEIRQEKKESPTAFLERLKEAARKYTDLQIIHHKQRFSSVSFSWGSHRMILGEKLQKIEGEELRNLEKMLEVAWKYVDDILIATEEKTTSIKVTIEILNSLGMGGYNISKEKAQIAQQTVIYLGCEISQGQQKLGTNKPQNLHELRVFLGMTGWCCLWIVDYGLIAKPLYEAQKTQPFTSGKPQKEAFLKLKEALTTAPALGLRLALGVLTQCLGSWKSPVGYFSKQLDNVSARWPSCLRAVAATVILIQEARKLTMGSHIEVYLPHMVITVLEQKGDHWLSPSRMMKFQVILMEQDDVTLKNN
ncbi:hypothetical protein DV515_00018509 [Chloebia gouldiae]|uniref:Reverse transcriptase domain-containing protein n=1 Tax=Chloebia gouldiae TaxID=44316 RepID=A0A3L8Q7A2_CHLGU|nr:hypothetical protein DV515_00018509 [Chloebia gouldiae]